MQNLLIKHEKLMPINVKVVSEHTAVGFPKNVNPGIQLIVIV